jgi:hypothetical protein
MVDAQDNITVEIWAYPGDGAPARVSDQFVYNLGTGPQLAPFVAGSASDLKSVAATHVASVMYTDWSGVDLSTIDTSDLTVTGGPSPVTVTEVSTQVSGSQVVATYTLSSSSGFTGADNGTYTVGLRAGAVSDTSGNTTSSIASLDTFNVAISVPATYASVGLGVTQAEKLSLSNYSVESNSTAQGGQLVRVPSGTGTARGTFTGESGQYVLKVAYYDENDGASTMTARVDGTVVATWLLNQNLGSASAVPGTLVLQEIPVTLDEGALIEITGTRKDGEHSRFDYIALEDSGSITSANYADWMLS